MSIKRKARLRIENKTRWSSDYLVIESHHRAYKRDIFTTEFPCPLRFEALELYLQILYPALKFNLIMQRTTSTIADVLPTLMLMLSKWSRMIVPHRYKNLCINLIKAFRHKFGHELKCPVYNVAALLNVAKLSKWQSRADCQQIRRIAIDNLVKVANAFRKHEVASPSRERTEQVPTSSAESVGASVADSLDGMLDDDDYRDPAERGIFYYSFNLKAIFCQISYKSFFINPLKGGEITSIRLETEKIKFLALIDSPSFNERSTPQFWLKHKSQLPMLCELALVLYNIPSASAFIERFYSLSGNVCKTRAGNMTAKTIVQRSFLKANSKILNKITIKPK